MQGENAVLNVLTIPPGASITTQRIVLDGVRGAIFVYTSGGPTGALIGSWSGKAGTDPYGNSYPAGLSVGSNIAANVNFSSLLGQIAGSQIPNGIITAGMLVANIVVAGIVNGTLITGAEIESTGTGLDFVAYNGTPASNNLAMSMAISKGTDSFSNDWLGGFSVYFKSVSNWLAFNLSADPSGSGADFNWYYTTTLTENTWVLGGTWSFAPGVASPTGTPLQYNANGQGLIIGASAIEPVGLIGYIQFAGQTAPSNKTGFIDLYANSSATALAYVGGDGQNINLQAHGAANLTGFTVTASTNTQFSNAWTINSGDAQNGTTYCLKVFGHGTQGSTQQQLVVQFSNGNAAAALPATFAAASAAFGFVAELWVTQVSATTANYFVRLTAGTAVAVGQSINVAFSTPFTLEAQARWGSTTGAPTVTSNESFYTRGGP